MDQGPREVAYFARSSLSFGGVTNFFSGGPSVNVISRPSTSTFFCTPWPVQTPPIAFNDKLVQSESYAAVWLHAMRLPAKCLASKMCLSSLYCCVYLIWTLSGAASVMTVPLYVPVSASTHASRIRRAVIYTLNVPAEARCKASFPRHGQKLGEAMQGSRPSASLEYA